MPKKYDVMDQSTEEAPQDSRSTSAVLSYSNNATGWVRGATGKPSMFNETAENKPGFDKCPTDRIEK